MCVCRAYWDLLNPSESARNEQHVGRRAMMSHTHRALPPLEIRKSGAGDQKTAPGHGSGGSRALPEKHGHRDTSGSRPLHRPPKKVCCVYRTAFCSTVVSSPEVDGSKCSSKAHPTFVILSETLYMYFAGHLKQSCLRFPEQS